MTVNAFFGQADADQIVRLVRQEQIDVLAVEELTVSLRSRLQAAGLEKMLPYRVDAKVGTGGAEGSGLWADRKLTGAKNAVPEAPFAMPSAEIQVGGQPVRVTVAHPAPPTRSMFPAWRHDLTALGKYLRQEPRRQIVLGDFNATYDHASFRSILAGRFQDATRSTGRGLGMSWSLWDPGLPPVVGIDHVLAENSAYVGDARTIQIGGCDHRAVVATIRP